MAFIGLQTTEPVNAYKVKLIDKGKLQDNEYHYSWKTYQYNKKYIVIKMKFYKSSGKLESKNTITLKKISKYRTRMVIKEKYTPQKEKNIVNYDTITTVCMIKSSLTVKQYYFQKVKKNPSIFPFESWYDQG